MFSCREWVGASSERFETQLRNFLIGSIKLLNWSFTRLQPSAVASDRKEPAVLGPLAQLANMAAPDQTEPEISPGVKPPYSIAKETEISHLERTPPGLLVWPLTSAGLAAARSGVGLSGLKQLLAELRLPPTVRERGLTNRFQYVLVTSPSQEQTTFLLNTNDRLAPEASVTHHSSHLRVEVSRGPRPPEPLTIPREWPHRCVSGKWLTHTHTHTHTLLINYSVFVVSPGTKERKRKRCKFDFSRHLNFVVKRLFVVVVLESPWWKQTSNNSTEKSAVQPVQTKSWANFLQAYFSGGFLTLWMKLLD